MKRWVCHGYTTVDVTKTIEASSRKKAQEKFESLGVPGLCHQCSDAGGDHEDSAQFNGVGDEIVTTEIEEEA